MIKYILVAVSLIVMTGCGGRELENRDYVMAMTVDSNAESQYNVEVAVAKLSTEEGKDKEEVIYKGEGETIENAFSDINNQTKGHLYLGHNRVMIIGNDFSDYKSLVDYCSKNKEISRDTVIVSANNTGKIIEAKNNDDTASQYIYDYFQEKNKFDLDRLMEYYNKEREINLPIVNIENENIVIG